MKNILLIVCTIIIVACSNSNQSTDIAEDGDIGAIEVTKHGADISEEGSLSPSQFLNEIAAKDSLDIKLTAEITEVCSKKGCWMKLDMGNGKIMRVTFKDYEFFVPKDAAGKTAILQGIAKMDTTDVATLKHYAEDADAPKEEIDAITEPEINYSFEAVGVIIKGEKSTKIE